MAQKRDYERLTIEAFGKHLLESNDLDPIYVTLWRLRNSVDPWSEGQISRWMIAYWCFYHAGVACYLSEFEGNAFWREMMRAAVNNREEGSPLGPGTGWPRASERRHFRGQQAVKAIESLRIQFPSDPESMVGWIVDGLASPIPFAALSERVRAFRGFGPWITFKVADMVDRVLEVPVDFSHAAIFMFKDPTKAALRLWTLRAGLPEDAEIKDKDAAILEVVAYLTDHFKSHKAPPGFDRPVGLQEVETILCKWKSHMNGHYPPFNDIDEIVHGLKEWQTESDSAIRFLTYMPKRGA